MTPAPSWQKALIVLALLLPGGLALTGCYLLARSFMGHPLRRWQRTRALDRMLK